MVTGSACSLLDSWAVPWCTQASHDVNKGYCFNFNYIAFIYYKWNIFSHPHIFLKMFYSAFFFSSSMHHLSAGAYPSYPWGERPKHHRATSCTYNHSHSQAICLEPKFNPNRQSLECGKKPKQTRPGTWRTCKLHTLKWPVRTEPVIITTIWIWNLPLRLNPTCTLVILVFCN